MRRGRLIGFITSIGYGRVCCGGGTNFAICAEKRIAAPVRWLACVAPRAGTEPRLSRRRHWLARWNPGAGGIDQGTVPSTGRHQRQRVSWLRRQCFPSPAILAIATGAGRWSLQRRTFRDGGWRASAIGSVQVTRNRAGSPNEKARGCGLDLKARCNADFAQRPAELRLGVPGSNILAALTSLIRRFPRPQCLHVPKCASIGVDQRTRLGHCPRTGL